MRIKRNLVAATHRVNRVIQSLFQRQQFLLIRFSNHIVGIQPKNPIPAALGKGEVARCRKVVHPVEMSNLGTERFGQRNGSIG